MQPTIKRFIDNRAVATAFAEDLVGLLKSETRSQSKVNISLSGGSTPKLLFQILADEYAMSVDWGRIQFFWGDERCVPPTDAESNFGEANKLLLSKIDIPQENIHRIHGESNPTSERDRYAQEVFDHVPLNEEGVPSFDLMLLGMGGDGHTASIFPHEIAFLKSTELCEVATHPESGQKRITLTGNVLNASQHVCYLVTGTSKASVLADIMSKTGNYKTFPTSHVMPENRTTFYIDESAAAQL